MRVDYLGPAFPGLTNPCVSTLGFREIPPECFLVEVSDEAGIGGEIQEGDLMLVDERRPIQHGDLAVMDVEGQLRLFRSHRIGGNFRLIPAGGGQGMFAKPSDVRGVVVHHRSIPKELGEWQV
ncbi:hypothetical protein HCU01_33590 [Halomonas cupida]|uniref:Peptidase S24/S26A/S26B/S26C domain-containing protein n=1 Tax=Halomonas cupida TaxID=44933 RepID=A0A1M7KGJ3_9GAMM|nr:S24 family peptidase [Halomonas cupida]GEN25410.1 hypothetical protein HCU01_33590 [Halomonas cupida]SHM64349.1 hypothetical protein SAMN05660971_03495 [Halomonas cupida]